MTKNKVYKDENENEIIFIGLMIMTAKKANGGRGGGGGGLERDGRPLVSWLGRIQAVWDRSDLTQPSFSRAGHVRLDLSHTTDIIPLSGETTADHHSTANAGEGCDKEGKCKITREN